MPSFKYYNVQILPLEPRGKMIGSEGYKRVFESLQSSVDSHFQNDIISGISYSLRNDYFMAPIKVSIRDDISFGKFMKYDKVDRVTGTTTDVEKFVSKGNDSIKKYKYDFVFDHKRHILAIEKSKALPSANILIEFIESTLDIHSSKLFPKHHIKIAEMTDANHLQTIIEEANSFQRVDVQITFSNSNDWDDNIDEENLRLYEEEMKDKGIDSIHHIEKSEKESSMSEPSKSAMAYLGLATKYGTASISYKNEDGKRRTYKMLDHPIVKEVKDSLKGKLKSTLDYALDIKKSINDADKDSIKATKTRKQIRKGINND